MEITAYIDHPERLDKDSLYKLRELVGRYPYYAAARLMFLQNLFLLHDPSFGEELRRAALFLPDRRVLFHLFEGSPFDIKSPHCLRKLHIIEVSVPILSSTTICKKILYTLKHRIDNLLLLMQQQIIRLSFYNSTMQNPKKKKPFSLLRLGISVARHSWKTSLQNQVALN